MTLEEMVEARLEAGRREYGDKSYDRPPEELLQEIREEIADMVGWSRVLVGSYKQQNVEPPLWVRRLCASIWREAECSWRHLHNADVERNPRAARIAELEAELAQLRAEEDAA